MLPNDHCSSAAVNEMTEPDIDLYIAGAGVIFPEHLTIDTVERLSACEVVCTNLPEARLGGLPEDIRVKCRSLWPLYQDGRLRRENYLDVTRAVLAVVEEKRPVAWLTPGHPLIFDSVSGYLLKEGRARGWKVLVLPAISCLDTILAEVEYDPAGGLSVHEATSLVMREIALVPAIATLILQPGAFLSDRAHLSIASVPADLSRLLDYLMQFYPATHSCAFVRSAAAVSDDPRVHWFTLKDMSEVPRAHFAGSTLFVPALNPR